MALFDTNQGGGLFDSLPNIFMTPDFSQTGILTDEQQKDLRNQATKAGLLGTALTYLATPKTENYGSALPYLAKAGLGGMNAAQDVYGSGLTNLYRQRLSEQKDDRLYNVDGALVDKTGKVIYQGSAKEPKLNTDIIDVGGKKILINKETGAPIQEFVVTKPPKEEDTFKQTNELRNTFQNLPEVKSWNITQPILMSAREASKDTSGASDLNLIYALGKALDPNSVVREGELELAAGTGSLGEKLKGYYKSTTAGGKLTPEVKQDLLRQIESRTYAQKKQYDSAKKQYTSIANKYKLDPSELFIEPIVEPLDTSQPVKRLSTQDKQALDWANANATDPRAAQIKQRLGL
jgi:hypothetical protein